MEIDLLPPVVTQTRASPARSARFAALPSTTIMEALDRQGWEPYRWTIRKTRKADDQPFARHIVRIRRRDCRPEVGDVIPEIILRNAQDGTSALVLTAGLYRLVCANGLLVGRNTIAPIALRHNSRSAAILCDAAERIADQFPRALARVEAWQTITLTPEQYRWLGEQAAVARFGPEATGTERDEQIEHLLTPRRDEDAGRSLWAVYNRLQENGTRGGFLLPPRENGLRARRVRSIERSFASLPYTERLWEAAEQIAQMA